MFKKRQVFLIQNLELFLKPFTLKTLKKKKGSLHNVFSPKTSLPNTRAIISFPRKKITKELQDFKSKLF
jgi:hypothetical protein